MARKMRKRASGLGTVWESTRGKWAIRWRENGQRFTHFGFGSKAEAELALGRRRVNLADGKPFIPPAFQGEATLDDYATDFLERRKRTHRAGREDGYRWKNHLAPVFGGLRPEQVNTRTIRTFLEEKLAAGANPATLRVYIALLSSLYEDLKERELVEKNPARGLPRSVMELMRSRHKPSDTPFLEKKEDIRRVYLALPPPLNIAFAIGALAGLRTGEIFGLRWANVDLEGRRIHVRESWGGARTKDKEARVVPIMGGLLPVLQAWKVKTGGEGLVIRSLRVDGQKVDKKTPGNYLRAALEETGLTREGLGWYEATRHTFASQWVIAGGSIEKLKELLGLTCPPKTGRFAA